MRRLKERIKTIEIETQQILEYAKLHFETQCRLTGGTGWNGRQIRNAFQSATALAQFECKSPSDPVHLQVRHFEIVAKAAAEFDDYLIRTTGHSDAERAAFNMMRTDSFNPSTSNPMSLESMMQARGYPGAGTAQMAFAGGVGGQLPAQAAFGGPMRSNFNTGQQGMQGMNQGNFSMGVGQGMPFQQAGYGMPVQSSAQAAFMGGAQMGNQQQMWPMQNQGQSSMAGIQQSGMGSMPQQVQQASGQAPDTVVGQQAPGQLPGQGQQPQGGNLQGPQGFNPAAGFQQYLQQGQVYQM
jgi:hypothetical protein